MDATAMFAVIALGCIVGAFYFGARIVDELHARNLPGKKLMLRFMIFKYMADYRRITMEETGAVGPLYQPCTVLLVLTAIFGLLAIFAQFA